MNTLMTNLETLGFTTENGLNGLSLENISVSMHWSGEKAVVAIDGKQAFTSSNENEILEFVKSQIKVEITEVEYNDDLNGFVVELKDGRTVQVQFEKETNRLHADFGSYFAIIDKENNYGLSLSDSEEEMFKDFMLGNSQIQDKVNELNA